MAQDNSDSAMESSVESSQMGDSLKPKPALAPKPVLAPKPFSLQRSTVVRKIQAPKTSNSGSKAKTALSEKPNVSGSTKPTLTTPAQALASNSASKMNTESVTAKKPPKTTEVNEAPPHKDVTLDVPSEVTTPAMKDNPVDETPKPESVEMEDVIQENHRASSDTPTNSEQKDTQKEENGTQASDAEKTEDKNNENSSETSSSFSRRNTPKRLSMKLTSMFETGGPAPLPKPNGAFSTTKPKGETQKPEPAPPNESPAAPAPSNGEDGAGEQKEDYTGGKSIKGRISLLFDSSSKQEVETKKQEQEIINGVQGVKDRIKNWVVETGSEAPQADEKLHNTPKTRSKNIEVATSPVAENSAQTPSEVPDAEEELAPPLDPPLPEEQSTETQGEPLKDAHIDSESLEISAAIVEEKNEVTEEDVPPCSDSQAAINEEDKENLRRKPAEVAQKKNKRRSVRFGTVVADDGKPPINLGSDPESSTDEESDEDEDVIPSLASVPVLKCIRLLQEKSDEIQRQKEEELKQKQKEKDEEQARLKLEEKQKRKEEENEEERQEKELKLREEEAERRSMQELERKRLEEQHERLKKDRIEKERLEELLEQMQKEDRVREKEEEENLEKEKTRSTMKEPGAGQPPENENIKEGNNEVEEKEEKVNTFEARKMDEELEAVLMKQRQEEEDRKTAKEMEERLVQEEREKERLREEEIERQRIKEEEEEEKLRQRRKEEERERRELERKREQEKKEEMEKLKLIEKQEEERKEEQRRKQMEEEREKELKKILEELEKQQAEELKARMQEEERQRKELELIKQEEENMQEPGGEYLISFEVEDLPQVSESLCSPSSNISEPTEMLIEVEYDDFSVKNPEIDVEFDDFSVKPRKRGSSARTEATPAKHNWSVDLEEMLNSVEFTSQEKERVPALVEKEEDEKSVQEQAGPKEEGLLVDLNQKEEEEWGIGSEEEDLPSDVYVELDEEETPEEEVVEPKPEEEVQTGEDEEEDDKEEQLNSRKNADQDVDALTHQTHQQNGICEQTSEIRRFKPISDHIPPDVTPEAHEEPDLPLLPESSTTLLDTSAQKSKAQLGRTRNRARPTRSLRAKPDKNPKLELRVTDYSDTTEISTEHRQSDSEEEKPKPNIYPSPSSQRVAAVPGVKPAVLIAHLKKKGIGKVDMEAEEKRPKEEKTEEAAPPPLSRSPRLRVPPAGAALVLPPLGDNDGSTKQSPAWLQELKSKKRISQLESA